MRVGEERMNYKAGDDGGVVWAGRRKKGSDGVVGPSTAVSSGTRAAAEAGDGSW
jgi:hypothetical protein